MKIKNLPQLQDQFACRRARKRGFGRHPHKFNFTTPEEENTMGIAQAALAKAAELRKNKPSTSTKKSTAPAAKKPRAASTGTRGTTEAENAKVVKMYKEGKNYGEISDAMGWTGKGDWPHSYTHGVINRLRKAGMLGYRRKPETKSVAKKGKK